MLQLPEQPFPATTERGVLCSCDRVAAEGDAHTSNPTDNRDNAEGNFFHLWPLCAHCCFVTAAAAFVVDVVCVVDDDDHPLVVWLLSTDLPQSFKKKVL